MAKRTWAACLLVVACGSVSETESSADAGNDQKDAPDEAVPSTSEDAGDGEAKNEPDPSKDPVAQLPPQGAAEIENWLAEEHYKTWLCEKDISPPRPGGDHGTTRVCWNDRVVGAKDTPYPAGASLVKELYTKDSTLRGLAVTLKVADGTGGDTWYFYERIGDRAASADGVGVSACAACHAASDHDYVFIRPPQ